MSEAENNTAQQQFAIQRIYIKDISFETPNSPSIYTVQWQPEVSLDINTLANKLSDTLYEVVLRITATIKVEDKTAYLCEVNQAGIFTIAGLPEENMGHMLHSYCPSILFPYAREVISDLVGKGSFPAFNLAPINFDALYAQHAAKQGEGEANASEAEAPVH